MGKGESEGEKQSARDIVHTHTSLVYLQGRDGVRLPYLCLDQIIGKEYICITKTKNTPLTTCLGGAFLLPAHEREMGSVWLPYRDLGAFLCERKPWMSG